MHKQIVLGLDVGTNSIGWGLVEIDSSGETDGDIIAGGVRIFNKGVEDKTPTPKNQKRRERRLARRVIQRRARRKSKMTNILVRNGFLPREITTESRIEGILNSLGDPYQLRAKALDYPLEAHEFGRVMLHLVQRRGFLSNKKILLGREMLDDPDVIAELAASDQSDSASDKEESKFKAEIHELRLAINNAGARSLGEFLASKTALECKRNRSGAFLRTDRQMYREEFSQIIDAQRDYLGLTDELIESLEHTIFHQRPLKLKEDRVGKCSLEPNSKRIACARLEFQRFRYLCDINNLRYFEAEADSEVSLSGDQRAKLIELFESKSDITFPQIRKALGLDKSSDFNLDSGVKKLKGNRTAALIRGVYPDWDSLDELKRAALVEDLISFQKKSALKKRLTGHWGIAPSTAIKLCMLELEPGHGSLSRKAINTLLPRLLDGQELSQARLAVGYGYDITKSNLPLLPPAPLVPNPIVQKALHEIRRVVNAIIKEHGKPDVVRLEMARDLEMNTKRYAAYLKQQKANTAANDEAVEHFKSVEGGSYPSRDDKIKYRLWKDQRCLCAYSGETISIHQLFSSAIEIDHILPYSQSLDDSYQNKVVCLAQENRIKGQKTPIDAFSSDSTKWDLITHLISKWPKSLSSKRARFFKTGSELAEKDFISTQLTDTRYIAKETGNYLKQLGCDVTYTKGVLTAALRKSWDLNPLISGGTDKDRTDHRHHLIDAVVTACIDRKLYKAIVEQARDIERSRSAVKLSDIYFDEPITDIKNKLDNLLSNVVVSHAVSRKLTGALHEETAVGFVEGVGAVYRKKLDETFTLKDVEKVYDEGVREILRQYLAKYGNDPKKAFKGGQLPIHRDGVTPIKRVRVCQSVTTYEELNKNKFGIIGRDGELFKWHAFGNNHRMDVYLEEGVFRGAKSVSTAEATKQLFNKDENSAASHPHYSLYKNSMVKLTVDGVSSFYRVQQIESPNTLVLRPHTLGGNGSLKPIRKTLGTLIREYMLEPAQINILGSY